MTPDQRQAALRLADELQRFDGPERESLRDETAALLRELAAEPMQAPVGWVNYIDSEFEFSYRKWMDNPCEEWHPVYAAPQQQRKPLSDEQIAEIRRECVLLPSKYESHYGWAIHFARAIEKAITGEQK